MLHVYHSNRLEALFVLLCTLRESQPLADPLTPEKVLVANPGIGRWLNLQIADRAGIAANIDYQLPAEFVWQLYSDCLDTVPDKSAFDRNALRLRVLNELDSIHGAGDELWLPLQRYLSADEGTVGDTKRVQLASRIADVFDQYLVYRPQMILDWERGADTTPGNDPAQRWQPALWRRLAKTINEPHRAVLWQRFCTLADRGEIDPALLPPQLHLFNVGLLPPSTLDVLVRLAKIGPTDSGRVSLYFLNPSIDYWADLLDMRRAARERLQLGAKSEPLADDQMGNPLLSSLGGSGRTLMKLLGDRSEWVHDEKFFLPAASDSLLAAVQADLLHPFGEAQDNIAADALAADQATGQATGQATDQATDQATGEGNSQSKEPEADQSSSGIHGDTSIQLHQCYSPMREVQALHDRLLDRFNADHTLTPADVIVMVPDINRYAPVIEAVFGSIGGEGNGESRARYIPWSVADRSLVEVSRIIACVQRLFELPGFEFEASAVMGFAAEPAIARRFGFDNNALKTITEWLLDTGVRRTLAGSVENNSGLGSKASEASKGSEHQNVKLLQQPVAAPHSWDFGIRRLLLARAMPLGSDAVADTLPGGKVEGQQAELLSQLLNLLQALEDFRAQLSKPRPPSEWVSVINDMVSRVLQPADDEVDVLAQFREMMVELEADAESAGHTEAMTHATFAEILRGVLAGAQRKNHRYLTGRVTFSSMVPLRSVPFRIVCMLGLNDSDFPRQRPALGFDLIAAQPQPGDRSVRDDDRYLFLEAILSARDELYLSWIYRNVSDNAAREPSVLVSELRDYLNKCHSHQPPLSIEHPLQPFSKRLFDPTCAAMHTFANEWEPPTQTPTRIVLNETGESKAPTEHIALEDFQRFWRNPTDWYARRVLGVGLWRDEPQPEDAEPFGVDGLSSYHLRSNLIHLMIEQASNNKTNDKQAWYTRMVRSGVLPHASLGELAFDTLYTEAQELAERIRVHAATPHLPLEIDIRIKGQQLAGRLLNVVTWLDGSVGVLHYHASKIKGSHVSPWWLDHLIGTAAGVVTGKSILVTQDTDRTLVTMQKEHARELLQPWFDGWIQGQVSALPFFTKTSAILAGATGGSTTNTWLPSTFGGKSESEQESIQLLYNNINQVPEREDVQQWADLLLGDELLKLPKGKKP